MTGPEFRAWRVAGGMAQADAARMSGLSLKTVQRAEAAPGAIPPKLARLVSATEPQAPAKPGRGKAAPAEDDAPVSPELAAAMLRNPPYATTSAEGKAMRTLRARQRKVAISDIRLLPLRPVWRRLPSGRTVNAAIPDPVDAPAPDWAGPRGVLTASGAVFDYEGAHRMSAPNALQVAAPDAGRW